MWQLKVISLEKVKLAGFGEERDSGSPVSVSRQVLTLCNKLFGQFCTGIQCVGWFYRKFQPIKEISRDDRCAQQTQHQSSEMVIKSLKKTLCKVSLHLIFLLDNGSI